MITMIWNDGQNFAFNMFLAQYFYFQLLKWHQFLRYHHSNYLFLNHKKTIKRVCFSDIFTQGFVHVNQHSLDSITGKFNNYDPRALFHGLSYAVLPVNVI